MERIVAVDVVVLVEKPDGGREVRNLLEWRAKDRWSEVQIQTIVPFYAAAQPPVRSGTVALHILITEPPEWPSWSVKTSSRRG